MKEREKLVRRLGGETVVDMLHVEPPASPIDVLLGDVGEVAVV
jgi:hypothetical protein